MAEVDTVVNADAAPTGSPMPERRGSKEQCDNDAAEAIAAIEKLITAGKEATRDAKESSEVGLAPGRTLRLRRKSKDLEAQCMELLGSKLEKAFKTFDLDGNGTLEQGELKAAFEAAGRPATEETIAKAVKELDTDGDGVISLDEFKAIAWKCAM